MPEQGVQISIIALCWVIGLVNGIANHPHINTNKPFFILNNHGNNQHPLLFGYFTEVSDHNSTSAPPAGKMAQLAINTHEVVPQCALTVAGAVHISEKDDDPDLPHSEHFSNFLLWVEEGLVSEDIALAPEADWDDEPVDGSGSIEELERDRWGDYVFDEEYDLTSLRDLEEFIQKHKHLPGIPSAEEIVKEGYSLKKMNKNYIVKIEELTLYTIEQDKKIKALGEQLKQYASLASEVEALKAQMKAEKE